MIPLYFFKEILLFLINPFEDISLKYASRARLVKLLSIEESDSAHDFKDFIEDNNLVMPKVDFLFLLEVIIFIHVVAKQLNEKEDIVANMVADNKRTADRPDAKHRNDSEYG